MQGDRCIWYYCCRKELINIQDVTINRSLCCYQAHRFKATRELKLVLSLGLYIGLYRQELFQQSFSDYRCDNVIAECVDLISYLWPMLSRDVQQKKFSVKT